MRRERQVKKKTGQEEDRVDSLCTGMFVTVPGSSLVDLVKPLFLESGRMSGH